MERGDEVVPPAPAACNVNTENAKEDVVRINKCGKSSSSMF